LTPDDNAPEATTAVAVGRVLPFGVLVCEVAVMEMLPVMIITVKNLLNGKPFMDLYFFIQECYFY
jgi:hypothetical protein